MTRFQRVFVSATNQKTHLQKPSTPEISLLFLKYPSSSELQITFFCPPPASVCSHFKHSSIVAINRKAFHQKVNYKVY